MVHQDRRSLGELIEAAQEAARDLGVESPTVFVDADTTGFVASVVGSKKEALHGHGSTAEEAIRSLLQALDHEKKL